MYFYMYKGFSETQKNDYLRSLVIAIGVSDLLKNGRKCSRENSTLLITEAAFKRCS